MLQQRKIRTRVRPIGAVLVLLAAFLVVLVGPAGPAFAAPPTGTDNVALDAAPDANYTPTWNSLAAINDGVTPSPTTTALSQMWGDYSGSRTSDGWISYSWDTPVKVSQSVISFWSDAAQAGTGDNVWLPKSWKLQYKSATATDWTDVPGADAYGLARSTPNVTTFPAITVTALRAYMQAYPNAAGTAYSALSVTEWEVWGQPDTSPPPSSTDPLAADEIDLPTTVGALPALPSSVWMTYADGKRAQVPVAWPTITSAQVSAPGSFSVPGTPAGVGTPVSATIYVRAAGTTPTLTSFLPMSALTVAGVAPQLPSTALAQYDDGTLDSTLPVTWATPQAADYAEPGLFTLAGTVAGTSLRPSITVFVDEPAVDDAAPVVQVDLQPDQPSSGWYVGPVTATVTASSDTDPDPAVEYKLDGGDWQKYTDHVTVGDDGAHTLTARATDKDGNVSADRSAAFSIDATAPETTATTADKGDTVQLELASADAGAGVATVQYQVGDGFIATYAGSPVGITKLTAAQTVRFFATDKAGNVEAAKTVEIPAKAATTPDPVSGSVKDADGKAVGNICVYLYGHGASDHAAYATCTGADGSWWIGAVANGTYDVAFYDPTGVHATVWLGPDGAGVPSQTAATPLIVAGAPVSAVALHYSAATSGPVSGSVKDAGGAAVANVCVYLYPHGNGSGASYATCTAADGTWWIGDVANGSYDVAFYDSTGTHSTLWLAASGLGVATQSAAEPISMTGKALSGTNLTYPAPTSAAMSGAVRVDGAGVGNICVYLYQHGQSAAAAFATCTAADGTWWLGDVANGVYDVAFYDSTGAHPTQWFTTDGSGSATQSRGDTVTVSGTAVTGIDANWGPANP